MELLKAASVSDRRPANPRGRVWRGGPGRPAHRSRRCGRARTTKPMTAIRPAGDENYRAGGSVHGCGTHLAFRPRVAAGQLGHRGRALGAEPGGGGRRNRRAARRLDPERKPVDRIRRCDRPRKMRRRRACATSGIAVGNRTRLLDAPSCAAGQLARCLGVTSRRWRDLVERNGENVVQDEGQPLGRRQCVQHHEQRQPHRLGQHRAVLRGRIHLPFPRSDPEGPPDQVLAAASLGGPQIFRQMRATTVVSQASRLAISSAADRAAAQPQPRLLDRVLERRRSSPASGRRSRPAADGPPRSVPPMTRSMCGHRFRAAHTRLSRKSRKTRCPSAMLNRARRLPRVITWVSPTSWAVSKCARSASNNSSLTSTGRAAYRGGVLEDQLVDVGEARRRSENRTVPATPHR